MSKLLEAQTELAARMSRIVVNLKKKGTANINEGDVQSRIHLLDRLWSQFETQHRELSDAALDEKTVRGHVYFTTRVIDQIEESYIDQRGYLWGLAEEFRRKSAPAIQDAKLSVSDPKTRVALPRINLPTFDGRFTEWPAFHDLFNSLILKDESLSDVDRLHYLKSSLKGDAAQFLSNLSTTDDNFTVAWEELQRRYCNLRLLIRSQYTFLSKLPALSKESPDELKRLLAGTNNVVGALRKLGRPYDASPDWLVHHTVDKLDKRSRRDWEEHQEDKTEPANYDDLRKFLEGRVHTLEGLGAERKEESLVIKKLQENSLRVHQVSPKARTCTLCRGNHFVLYCPIYQKKSPQERNTTVNHNHLCPNCLGKHKIEACTSPKRCQKCADQHHTTLHETYSILNSSSVQHASIVRSRTSTVILSTVRLKVRGPASEAIVIRALIDPGSEVSLIAESLVQRLMLRRTKARVPLTGVGSDRCRFTRGRTSFTVTSLYNNHLTFEFSALVLNELSCYQPRNLPRDVHWPHLTGIALADPDYPSQDSIEMLLGADVYNQVLFEGVRRGGPNSPVAQETAFGWILTGTISASSPESENTSLPSHVHHCSVDQALLQSLTRFWEQEEIEASISLSSDDQICEDHFVNNHRRSSDGRFVVKLPFKNLPQQGESRGNALRSLQVTQRRFDSNAEFQKAYTDFMVEYKKLGHMVAAKSPRSQDHYYLPHHGVYKHNSTTTKLRVVFNGSMVTRSGKSLNDHLHTGPNLLPRLFDILLRWRKHEYVFTADVEKMYRQIWVHPEDRRWQQVLWREDDTNRIRDYQLCTLTYGLACAPFLAIRCLKQRASEGAATFRAGSQALLHDVYMDDVLSGASSVTEALMMKRELDQLLKAGGFHLRKWRSNQPAILEGSANLSTALSLDGTSESACSVLGIQWNPATDYFQCTVNCAGPKRAASKRAVLSQTAQIFDPLRWLTPLTVYAKLVIQRLWLLKADWDSPLPSREDNHWSQWLKELPSLNDVRIPRWLGYHPDSGSVQLHGFADASQNAFAAVVYCRIISKDGMARTTLVTAKSRVAPLKRITLPRLELNAAHLVTRLTAKVAEVLQLQPMDIHLWTDSLVALGWIKGHPSRWKNYVANRVSDIQQRLPVARWHHVPGTENPADCASRGLLPEALKNFTLWWSGPNWLNSDTSWPSNEDVEVDSVEEERAIHYVQRADKDEVRDFIARFSNLSRLLRITAWCLRWMPSLKGACTRYLTAEEIRAAKVRLFRAVQRQAFSKEITSLLSKRELPSSSRLIRLSPFLDGDGLLRVGGRLQRAALPYSQTHPVILPDESPLATLWIEDVHQRCLHGGVQLTLATLRQECWILRGRQSVKACLHRCHTCLRWKAQASHQLMGNLPQSRLTPCRPFYKTGLDYAGPILIKTSSGRGQKTTKGYLAIFVCLATKAVHLEVVSDGSTDTFLAALKRFVGRRGICAELHSDCGTVFVGADRELRRLVHAAGRDNHAIVNSVAALGIEWKFIPPASPHFGGLWEAAVKSVKYHLRRQIGERKLTFEELTTLLVGGPLNAIPEPNLEDLPVSRLSRWQLVQQLLQHFWRRWSREYLNTLQTRGKWCRPQPNLQEGTLCLLKQENLPPTRWPLARITEVHAGADGFIRVVTVKTQNSTLRRPIAKVIVLPTEATQSRDTGRIDTRT